MRVPVFDLNTSLVTCEVVPTPPEPTVMRSGRDFSNAISSVTLFACTDGCSTNTIPALAIIETGVKSAGSQFSFL